MRLDHLLSKENIVFLFVLSLGGCWLAPGGGKIFCFQVKASIACMFHVCGFGS